MTENKNRNLKKVLIIIMVFFLVNIVAAFVVTKIVYDNQFPRLDKATDSYAQCSERKISFYSGDNLLQGYVFGDKSQKGLVVVSPGHNSCANSYCAQIDSLVDYGYQVFSYDATGTLDSEGSSCVGFPQAIIDLDSALDYIENDSELSFNNLYLFGHSQGGYAACNMLFDHHDISAVVCISGVNNAMEAVIAPVENSIGYFAYTGYPFLYLYQCTLFGSDTVKMNAVDAINSSDTAVMIVHGTSDDTFDYTKSSLMSHKDEITNPNVVYYTCDTSGASGHTSLLYESGQFEDHAEKQKVKKPEANKELMSAIESFFEENQLAKN